MMKRVKLEAARHDKKLSQKELASELGVSRETVSLWERGISDPQASQVRALCNYFERDPQDLDLAQGIPRRQVLQMIVGAGTVGAMMNTQMSISPEEFLCQCRAGLQACWQLLQHRGFATVETMISTYMPTLTSLIYQSTAHREAAASLAAQAKIIQAILTKHKLDFASREMHCLEAVRFAEISGDEGMLCVARIYQAYTYVYHIIQPGQALALFEAAQSQASRFPLLGADIAIGMADAYGQIGDERSMLESVERAHILMPSHIEQDLYSLLADLTGHGISQREAKAYLSLAEHGKPGYHQKAYDAYTLPTGHVDADRNISESAIQQASAAAGIGDLDQYTELLQSGLEIAYTIDSKIRYSEAVTTLQKAPRAWYKEKKYKDLTKLFVK